MIDQRIALHILVQLLVSDTAMQFLQLALFVFMKFVVAMYILVRLRGCGNAVTRTAKFSSRSTIHADGASSKNFPRPSQP